jgi:thiamine-monophosphate kinase
LIFVSGEIGGAAGGLKLLQEGIRYRSDEKIWRKHLLLKQLQPFPQVSTGNFLIENNLATSMIDLSDGLSSDLTHICHTSKVGARIFADKIPFDKKLHSIAKSFDTKIDFALNGGEDFELLFTVSPKKYFRFENEFKKQKFFHVGEIIANVETIELITSGKSMILEPKGFRHF